MTHERFKTTILTHQADMYRLAFKVTHNSDDASDMVQDTFVNLWNRRDELDGIANTHAYCMTAVRNRCLVYLRTRHILMPLDNEDSTDSMEADSAIRHGDSMNLLNRIIDTLPPNQQMVIKMSTFAQCSNDEIAAATGLSDANVRTLLSRARHRIKELFSKYN